MERALRQERVTYGAVGATQALDLFSHPPRGFKPLERRARIGHGNARFEWACSQAMCWGIQRNSGMRVETDGGAVLEAGDSAKLIVPILGKLAVRVPVRVVYTVEEPWQRGFAYGTLAGHPISGEESFVISLRDDNSVWLTLRAFSRPSSRFWWTVGPAVRLAQSILTKRLLRSLAGPMD